MGTLMNWHTKLILQDCRKRQDIPTDFQMYMADEIQYLDENTPAFDLHLCTSELLASVIYFKPNTRILAGSNRAHLTLDEIKAEVKCWSKDWPIAEREKDWLRYLRLT